MARFSQVDGKPPTPAALHSPPKDANPPAARPPPSIPDYELLRRIGSGSYGDVWLARNAVGTLRAVKIAHRKTFWSDRPFEREFKGIQKFEPISRSHEGLVDILQIGRGDGYFYYVMELADDAEGKVISNQCSVFNQAHSDPLMTHYSPRTLTTDLARHHRLPPAECVRIGLALTDALAHLHKNGLVHRDIKPANIIFVCDVPKLADIGLVAEVSEAPSYVGTEGFIPPEGPGTPQADLYSLGKLLYEISTGQDRHAFPALPSDLAEQSEAAQLVELNAILLKACQPDPRERYRSAEAMRADLERLRQGVSIRQVRRTERRWRELWRGAKWAATVAVILSASVLVIRTGRQPVPRSVERQSTNEVANRFFDLGLHSFEKLYALDALTNFQKAIVADPNFARAHAELALIYMRAEVGKDNRKSYAAGKAEAELALKLDPSLPLAHIVIGWSQVHHGFHWDAAEKSLVRALALDPRWDRGHHAYAEFLKVRGRTNEAVAEMREALRCNPQSVRVRQRLPYVLLAARRYEEAIKEAEDAIAMEPNIAGSADDALVNAWCARGDYLKAIEGERRLLHGARTSQDKANRLIGELQNAFEAEGAKGYWRVKLERAKQDDADPYELATLYAQLGEREQALDCLRTCLRELAFGLVWMVKVDWQLDPLRSDPAFQDILKNMNLE